MGDKTGIEWTDSTWNPVRGCSRVSAGCTRCYAETVAARFSGPGLPYEGLARRTKGGEARWTGQVRMVPEHLDDPLRWKRPRRIFVNSMSDLFHEGLTNEQIAAVFGVMASAPRHTFQILTKRPTRMREWFEWIGGGAVPAGSLCVDHTSDAFLARGNSVLDREFALLGGGDLKWPWPLPNVWLGVSVEDQAAADERIPLLLETPAAVRFLSCEPLLGLVDLRWSWVRTAENPDGVAWVIAGGESGPSARPMHPGWARFLRDQCAEVGVPFFFKQWGEWAPVASPRTDYEGKRLLMDRDGDTREASWSDVMAARGPWWAFEKHGKKAAGSLLDGVEHKAFPL